MTASKHPDCDPCDCGAAGVHCRHAHQPWFGLSDDERAVLDLERRRFKHPAVKAELIRERFGWSEVRYFQVLGALIDRPDVVACEPVLVGRLRRLEVARREARTG